MSHTRRLTAIMFTDIVGYTAMMQRDEATSMAKVSSFRYTMAQQVEKHHGELLEIRGDGSLSVFSSATDAVACAKEIQENLREDVPLRIGIHLGDIVQKDGHIFGDAVNIASRIESMGVAGAVLVSSNVRNQIKNKPEFELSSLGRFTFKNVEEDMSVYALANEGFIVPSPEDMQGKGRRITHTPKKSPAKTWIRAASIGFVAMIVGASLFWLYSSRNSEKKIMDEARASRIAVLPYKNNTGDESLDVLGEMTADWIIQGLMELDDMKVVSFDNVREYLEYANESGSQQDFAERTGAEKLIRGSYYLEGDNIMVQSQIVNPINGEIELALPIIRGPKDQISTLVTDIQQRIVTSFMALAEKDELAFAPRTFQNPPARQAYLYYIEGRDYFGIDDSKLESLMSQSIEVDSTFFWPYIYISVSSSNRGRFTKADSVLQLISRRIGMEKLSITEKAWYDIIEALNKREYERAFDNLLLLLEKDPKQIMPVFQATRLARFLLKHNQGVQIASHIDPAKVSQKFVFSAWWFEDYAHLLYRLNRMEEALNVSNHLFPKFRNRFSYYDRKAEVFVAQNKEDSLHVLIQHMEEHDMAKNATFYEFVWIAERFGVNQQPEKQIAWAKRGIEWMDEQTNTNELRAYTKGCLYYFSGQYEKALSYFEIVYEQNPQGLNNLSRLGCTYVQLGEIKKAQGILTELEQLFEKTNNSYCLMVQAHIYSIMDEKDQAVDMFEQAIKAGQLYSVYTYDNDIMFVPLEGYAPFEELVRLRD